MRKRTANVDYLRKCHAQKRANGQCLWGKNHGPIFKGNLCEACYKKDSAKKIVPENERKKRRIKLNVIAALLSLQSPGQVVTIQACHQSIYYYASLLGLDVRCRNRQQKQGIEVTRKFPVGL